MPLPPKLEQELTELRAEYQIQVVEDAEFICLIFSTFPLGDGFTLPSSDLLLRVPRSYNDAGPDMFWTSPEVLLSGGGVPQNADSLEDYCGRKWRRFSWHRGGWNPTCDNLHGHMEFIRRRLREKK